MALGTTLNTIDTDRAAISSSRATIDAERDTIGTARESLRTQMQTLEIDLKEANVSGAGPIPIGFLDGHPAGTVQKFEYSNSTRRINFDYDVDSDTILNIVYVKEDRNTGTL